MEDCQTKEERERSLKNERERNRVKALHDQFMDLKERLPDKEQAKTKLQILQKATEYIDYLEEMIYEKERVQKRETELNRPSCRYSMGSAISYLQHFSPPPSHHEFAQTSQEIDWESDFTAQLGYTEQC